MSFLAELKRRNVYRVAALYIVSSWLILQVTDVVLSVLELPALAGKLVFFLLAAGFPIALILAWAFELTPEGVVRDQDRKQPLRSPTSSRKKMDYVILLVLLVAVAYFAWNHQWQKPPSTAASPNIRSIVVLPFDNLMNDPAQAYFVAGMHESLILELSKIEALRVISKTSARQFQESGKSIPQIASELGVEAAVEGSVLKAGDTVRINVQLIDAGTDQPVWSGSIDRELKDILSLYSEVTREITDQIRLTLTPEEQRMIAGTDQVNPEAYQLFLKGRFLCENWSPGEMAEGVRMLERAVELEPDNALTLSQLAVCLQYSAFFGYLEPEDIHDRSLAAAVRAVELDPNLAEAHAAKAGVEYYLFFDPKAALRSLDRALELNPNSVRALLHLSWLLGEAGETDLAVATNQKAIDLDPLSTSVNHALGQALFLGGRTDEALTVYQKVLELDRSDPALHWSVGWALEALGRWDEAINSHAKAVELSGGSTLYRAFQAHTLGVAGYPEAAREMLDELESDESASAFQIAIVHLGLGEHEKALDWLERSYGEGDSYVVYTNKAPMFDPLRNEPRFMALIDSFGWP